MNNSSIGNNTVITPTQSQDPAQVEDPTKLLESLGVTTPQMPANHVTQIDPDKIESSVLDPKFVSKLKGLKKIASKITDFEGRYGFLVDKGKYVIDVKKTSYIFPSKIMKGRVVDGSRKNLYFGEEINVEDSDLMDMAIPIDPVSFDWNQASKPKQYKPPLFPWKDEFFTSLTYVGLIFTFFVYLIDPTNFNLAFLIAYVGLIVFNRFTYKPKRWGTVFHKFSREVLPLVTVRAKREDGVVDGECQTDHQGRYYILLREGKHNLEVEQTNQQGQTQLIYRQEVVVSKSRVKVAPDLAI